MSKIQSENMKRIWKDRKSANFVMWDTGSRGRIPWNKGKKLNYSGHTKPHSTETKLKMSESHKKMSVETRQKLSISHTGKRGSQSSNWRGGITPMQAIIRNSIEYKLWRESVFKRDNFACQHCQDDKGGNLHAHHIKPFSLFPDLRLAIDNGITLCKDCHKNVHKINKILTLAL